LSLYAVAAEGRDGISSLVACDSRISAFSRDEESTSNKIVSELKAEIRRYEINWCRTAGSNSAGG
jgi:hypothetical protein